MVYTFQISDVSAQSHRIINMLLSLSKDYDFLEIIEEDNDLSAEQEADLDERYELFLQNPTIGRSWTEVKAKLLGE